jgi:hypothetical protein
MSEKRIGIIMHGVTGRMGMNQHLIRSILEIRKQGGVAQRSENRGAGEKARRRPMDHGSG